MANNLIRRTIKSKSGVTLIELVMVMAIMGILSIAISVLVTSASGAYSRSRDKITAANIGYSIWYDIEEHIKNSSEIYISTSAVAPTGECNSFYVKASAYDTDRDVLYYKDTSDLELYGANEASVEAFYGVYEVSLKFSIAKVNNTDANYTLLTLMVILTSQKDSTVYECEPYTFSLSNIKSSEDGILANDDSAGGSGGYKKGYSSSYTYSYLYYYV